MQHEDSFGAAKLRVVIVEDSAIIRARLAESLAEIPNLKSRHKTFTAIKGEIPSPLNPPGGCHFHPRCPHAMARCKTEVPSLKGIAINHLSACHLNDMA